MVDGRGGQVRAVAVRPGLTTARDALRPDGSSSSGGPLSGVIVHASTVRRTYPGSPPDDRAPPDDRRM
jgi:hypothetical protein